MAETPVVACALRDSGAAGAERAARFLAGEAAKRTTLLVLGDKRVLARGAARAGVTLDLPEIALDDVGYRRPDRSWFVDLGNCDPQEIAPDGACEVAGHAALDSLRCALAAAHIGFADAVFHLPADQAAMRLAEADYGGDAAFIERALQADGLGTEFSIIDTIWTARVTGHLPMSAVPRAITVERVLEVLMLTRDLMGRAGVADPRIAVAGLNPHAGDDGNFGDEEIVSIEPAVTRAAQRGIRCEGPLPADAVFLRALAGEFDAVLAMYHDQAQIPLKMMGLDRGATLIGGYPFPIVAPASVAAANGAGEGAVPAAATRALELAVALARDPAEAPMRDEALEDVVGRARAMGLAGGASVAATAAAALAL